MTANRVGSMSTTEHASTVPRAMIGASERRVGYSEAQAPVTANEAAISQRRLDRSASRPPGRASSRIGTAKRLMVMPDAEAGDEDSGSAPPAQAGGHGIGGGRGPGLRDAPHREQTDEHRRPGHPEDGGVPPERDQSAEKRPHQQTDHLARLQLGEPLGALLRLAEIDQGGAQGGDVRPRGDALEGAQGGEQPEWPGVGEEGEGEQPEGRPGPQEHGAPADAVGEPPGRHLHQGVGDQRPGDEQGDVQGAPAAATDVERRDREHCRHAREHDELAAEQPEHRRRARTAEVRHAGDCRRRGLLDHAAVQF
jgi:hypothetical protein